MSSLDQLLGYLDRDGVTEVALRIGRPITIRSHKRYVALGPIPLTGDKLDRIVAGTPLGTLLAGTIDGITEIDIGKRRLRVEVWRGADLALRIEPVAPVVAVGKPTRTRRAERASRAPRRPTKLSVQHKAALATPAPDPTPPSPPPPADDRAVVVKTPLAARNADVRPPAAPPPPAVVPVLIDEPCDVSAIAPLLRAAREAGASDLHVASNRPVTIRKLGEVSLLQADVMSATAVEKLLYPLLGPARRAVLANDGYVDLAVEIGGGGRIRANISRQQGGLRGAFRLAFPHPPTLDELGLPRDLAKLVAHHQGLVIVAGPSGHGKTSTLAALVDLINTTKTHHIITIEDPIEIVHPRKASVITQREVGRHTASFATALKASLREDPDVIVIGELRDRETVEIALTAAETGHLVLATMSTPSAAKTIDRLIDMFPPDEQTQARVSLASALRAIVGQRLLPGARNESVVAAIELITNVLPLAQMIREGKLFQLPNLMQRGRAIGMIKLADSAVELARVGKISEETMRMFGEKRSAKP